MDPLLIPTRIWNKINKRGPVFKKLGRCWLWTAHLNNGYGRVGWHGENRLAYKVMYEVLIGPYPGELQLDHLCRNRACVNPNHLEPVTRSVNCRRGDTGVFNSSKTHCPSGHALVEENVYMMPLKQINAATGERLTTRCCRTCRRLRQKATDVIRKAERHARKAG